MRKSGGGVDLWLLYLDEDVPLPLAIALRMLGYDVFAPKELRGRRISDARQMDHAVSLGRIMVTRNAKDFRLIHETLTLWAARWDLLDRRRHYGILIVPEASVAALSQAIDEFAQSMPIPDNRLFVWDRRIGWYDPYAPIDPFAR
jgi:Domain of unknown function (DUF5615)